MVIHLIHEDPQLLVVSKPAGQVVIPGRGKLSGLPLLQEMETLKGEKLYVVHRLDRGASGVLIFARTPEAHRSLSLQFEHREVQKSYLVLVQGIVPLDGRIDQPLREFGSGRMGVAPQGKLSTTDYHVREAFKGATLLDVSPHSGRRHQIRVHLFSIGHPVMGDPLYGKDRPVGGMARLMLHASRLTLQHPDGGPRTFHADPPPDFADALAHLRA